ncbi:MAG TPA: ATP-binding cassette domain-containing protein, partial [Dongiaceae bacterium]|nr:ATP-binding cassette domain-containing protein [Dongiaceae bacterium]
MQFAAATQTNTRPATQAEKAPVLELRNVAISYFVRAGEMKVVPNISFKLGQGEALGLVGESGCGKSTVAFAVMQYLGTVGRITNGQVLFEGKDLAKMSPAELR